MQKSHWLDFISGKFKSQISLETVERFQLWGLALVSLFSLGFALNILTEARPSFLFGAKILFVLFSHIVLIFGFYLPSLLQKGEDSIARFLGFRDPTSLTLVSAGLAFFMAITFTINYQIAAGGAETRMSDFFGFMNWANVGLSGLYLAGFAAYFFSLSFAPNFLAKTFEKSYRVLAGLLVVHLVFAILQGFSYAELYKVGDPVFFEQFRLAGLFWIFMTCAVLFTSRLMRQSAIPALSAMELEIASGRIERSEDILARFKEAYVLRRFGFWINRLSRQTATRSHELAELNHQAVQLVSQEKPVEAELIKVEEFYKKGETLYKKLNRENQKFLLKISLFTLNEAEREKADALRDQFSRELRNAKLELSSVRQRIDEKLVALKNKEGTTPQEIPVEQVPVSSL